MPSFRILSDATSDFPSMPSMPTQNADWASSSGEPILGRIDHYELVRKLGGGGFGVVYLARDTVSGIEVAIKTLHPALKRDAEEMERLRTRFALIARLSHPGIATALVLHPARDIDIRDEEARCELRLEPGDTVMVMRYAPGITLSRWRRQFPDEIVPLAETLDIGRQIAAALDYAHAEKIVHRDIKPANIMVETNASGIRVRILDFGLAAEIRSSLAQHSVADARDTSGTRPYMAPEQWAGRKQDDRTDQYALACLLYEMLSGAPPFAGAFETGDPAVMLLAVEQRSPEPLRELSARANAAFVRALAKKPADRFPSCLDFVEALASHRGLPIQTLRNCRATVARRLATPIRLLVAAMRRRPWMLPASALAALALVAAIHVVTRVPRPPVPGRRASTVELIDAKKKWIEFRAEQPDPKLVRLADQTVDQLDNRITDTWKQELPERLHSAEVANRSLESYQALRSDPVFKLRFDAIERSLATLRTLSQTIPSPRRADEAAALIAEAVRWIQDNADVRRRIDRVERDLVEGLAEFRGKGGADLASNALAMVEDRRKKAIDLRDSGRFEESIQMFEEAVKLLDRATEERKREEAQKAEEERKKEEARKAEEREKEKARKAAEERKREETRKAEEERKREEARKAEEHKKEDAQKAEEERKREAQRKALGTLWENTEKRSVEVSSFAVWHDPFYSSRIRQFTATTNDLAKAIAAGRLDEALKAAAKAETVADEMSAQKTARGLLSLEEKRLEKILKRVDVSSARYHQADLCRQADERRREAENLRDDREKPNFTFAAERLNNAIDLYEKAISAAPPADVSGTRRTIRLRDSRDSSGKSFVDLDLTYDGQMWQSDTITQAQWLAIDEASHAFSRKGDDLPADFLNMPDIEKWLKELALRPECAGWRFTLGSAKRHSSATHANARNLTFTIQSTTAP